MIAYLILVETNIILSICFVDLKPPRPFIHILISQYYTIRLVSL